MEAVEHHSQVKAGTFSRESKGKVSSIDDQTRDNEAACVENGWDVVARYSDKVSASRFGTKAREDWPKVMEDVAAGTIDVLVIWEISRADRDVERWAPFLGLCRKKRVRIHVTSAESTYSPWVAAHWKALIDGGVDAAYESEKVSSRTLKGTTGAALAGKAHGSAPYGLVRVYDSQDRRKFNQQAGENAPIVQEIVQRIARQDPLKVIVDDLNSRGVPAPQGGLWSRKTVKSVAMNVAYIGMRRHHDKLYAATWDAIVDPETFNAAQAVLTSPERRNSAPGSFKWLLSYLATGQCGGPMHAIASGTRRARYSCYTNNCTSVDAVAADEWVTRVILGKLAEPETRSLFERSDTQAAAARAEVARLEAQLDAARSSYARPDGISEIALAAKEQALQPLIDKARARIVSSTAPLAVLHLIGDGEFTKLTARPRWEALSIAAQRNVISTVVERIVFKPATTRLSRWTTEQHRLLHVAERTEIDFVEKRADI